MRLLRTFVALVVCLLPLLGAGSVVPLSEYKVRRQALRKGVGNGIVILVGGKEATNGELRTGFFQEPNFFYLTGWTEPGAILVITPNTEALLIPKHDKEHEKWTGQKLAPEDSSITSVTGFDAVLPVESFEAKLPEWLQSAPRVYTLTKQPSGDALKSLMPLREIDDVEPLIARLRMVKSQAEIAAIQHATDVTIRAHEAAWKATKPGVAEYQIAGVLMGSYFTEGCERNAYAPIIGSGPDGTYLHYSRNSRHADMGELVLMDAAAECAMYTSDITRTIPVNGKFTPRQRELYNVVLGAEKAVIAAVKPGVMIRSGPNNLNKVAKDYIDSHGKDLHGEPLGKYFTHGISHHVGLEVHDASDIAFPLSAGMVITVEPGIYIPEENIGIRIEDVVLVTENGAKVLSSGLPKEPGEIEKALAASR